MVKERLQLATTFRPSEVKLAHSLLQRLLSGADTKTLARDPAMAGLSRKFLAMQRKAEQAASAAEVP